MSHLAKETTGKGSYLFEDLSGSTRSTNQDEIRRGAHVANGGEVTQFACPRCRGSGVWRGHSRSFTCLKCRGTGKVSKGVAAAAKGKVTKQANRQAWMEEHAAEIAYINKRVEKGSTYYLGLKIRLDAHGSLFDSSIEGIRKDMAKDQEFFAKKKAEREAAAPVVEISAIEKLFATAVDNDVKRPIFRADGLEISKAPATGKNAGSLYVKRNGEYAGKITDGKFHKVYAAPADTVDRLMAVAADPLKEAMAYGRKFGNCALCGRDLVDPVSIRAKVGPVCAPKWGLDYLRDAARESLAVEKNGEAHDEG